MGNLEEMDKFLETYKRPKLKQEEIEKIRAEINTIETKTRQTKQKNSRTDQ